MTPACCGTVYPRECGGTAPLAFYVVVPEGLSPRVRGNRGIFGVVCVDDGSIPASAGEPSPTITNIINNIGLSPASAGEPA